MGLEEGGGKDREEILKRLLRWEALGQHETEDIVKFHAGLGGVDWFGPTSKTQSTWRQLIRTFLMAKTGRPPTDEEILTYQRKNLARERARETALLELMPLPSRSVRNWIYTAADLPELKSRRTYSQSFREDRARHLRSLIEQHEPSTVVFYGARRSWPGLLRVEIDHVRHFDTTILGKTLLVFTPHPTAFGVRNDTFLTLGEYVRQESSGAAWLV